MVSKNQCRKVNVGSLHLYVVLELLAVHPDYQRLGAGTALVKWGTKAADEQRLMV
jgi:GNAT superfamily N-acetyltransferase